MLRFWPHAAGMIFLLLCCRGAHAVHKLCVRLTGWAALGKGATGTATLLAIGTLGMEVSVYSLHLPFICTARVPSMLTSDYSGHCSQGMDDTAAASSLLLTSAECVIAGLDQTLHLV